MAIPDPEKIWPKLDEIGPDEVRKRIAMGVYADFKLPVIHEWLRRQEAAELQGNKQSDGSATPPARKSDSRFDHLILICKNNKVIAILLVAALLIIGLGQLTDAFNNIFDFGERFATAEETVDREDSLTVESLSNPQNGPVAITEQLTPEKGEVNDTEQPVMKTPVPQARTPSVAEVERAVRSQTALLYDVKLSTVTPNTRFEDIESPDEILPGLGVVEIVIELEKKFGCTITDDVAERIFTVNDAVLAVMSCK